MTIAIIAHDGKKADMVQFLLDHKPFCKRLILLLQEQQALM